MSKSLLLSLGLVLVIGFVGFALGQRQGMSWGEEQLRQQTAGVLAGNVEIASALRVSDQATAFQLLEGGIDRSIVALGREMASGHRSESVKQALGLGKMYRQEIPPLPTYERAVLPVLETVSLPDPSSCSPSVRRLVTKSE